MEYNKIADIEGPLADLAFADPSVFAKLVARAASNGQAMFDAQINRNDNALRENQKEHQGWSRSDATDKTAQINKLNREFRDLVDDINNERECRDSLDFFAKAVADDKITQSDFANLEPKPFVRV